MICFHQLQTFPTLGIQDLVQRVHVDPQIREQEFGNFQDPGLTQKAPTGPGANTMGFCGRKLAVVVLARGGANS